MSRQILTAAQSYYVRKNGSDANSGLANDDADAWGSWQHALDFIAYSLDLAGQPVTVNIAQGAYSENLCLPSFIGGNNNGYGQVTFLANPDTGFAVTDVKLAPASGQAIFGATNVCPYTFKRVWIECPNGVAIEADNGATIVLDGVTFGAAQLHCQSLYSKSSIVFVNGADGGYWIAGDAGAHWYSVRGDIFNQPGLQVRLLGTRTFADPFYFIDDEGFGNITGTTYTGSFTGTKYALGAYSRLRADFDPNSRIPGSINGP